MPLPTQICRVMRGVMLAEHEPLEGCLSVFPSSRDSTFSTSLCCVGI